MRRLFGTKSVILRMFLGWRRSRYRSLTPRWGPAVCTQRQWANAYPVLVEDDDGPRAGFSASPKPRTGMRMTSVPRSRTQSGQVGAGTARRCVAPHLRTSAPESKARQPRGMPQPLQDLIYSRIRHAPRHRTEVPVSPDGPLPASRFHPGCPPCGESYRPSTGMSRPGPRRNRTLRRPLASRTAVTRKLRGKPGTSRGATGQGQRP